MKTLFSLLATIVIVIFTLVCLLGVGKLATNSKRINHKVDSNHFVVYLNVSLGVIFLTGFYVSRYLGSPKNSFIGIGFIGFVFWLYLIFNKQTQIKSYFQLIIPVAIAAWLILPNIFFGRTSDLLLNMVTHGNNDIANYAASSQVYLDNGFFGDGNIDSFNMSHFNLYGAHQGPNNLLAFIASISNLDIWQVTTPTMMFTIVLCVLSISRMIVVIFNEKKPLLNLGVPFVILSSAIMVYVQGNYFLGQLFALAVAISLIANTISIYKKKALDNLLLLEHLTLVFLSFFSYPVVLIPFYFMTLILLVSYARINYRELYYKKTLLLFGTALMGVLINGPYLRIAIDLFKNQSEAVAGWQIPQLNPFSMFIYPSLIGTQINKRDTIISWVVFTAIILVLVLNQDRFKNKSSLVLFTILPPILVFFFIQVRGRGFDEYGSWKLQSFFIPVYLGILLPIVFLGYQKRSGVALVLLIGMLFPSAITNWSNGGTLTGFYISKDLVKVGELTEIRQLEKLNIDLLPNYETMAAGSVIRGPRLYMSSAGYWPLSNAPNSCYLINIEFRSKYKYVSYINESYAIASNNASNCPLSINQSKRSSS